jgi:murein DD-endopeptidase MepM/ murein hydrolase activator NlpD
MNKMVSREIDYDAFRNLRLEADILEKAKIKVNEIKKDKLSRKEKNYTDEIGYITFSMMADGYDLTEGKLVDDTLFCRGIYRVSASEKFRRLYGYYKAIIGDLSYFPVPKVAAGEADISYVDSWYQPRNYGGDRKHEGTDLMASNNIRGFFPVVSVTDGTIEKMGWLEQGGYRIGIRSASGGYFYYAHFNSYAPELKQGDRVIAGQLLGFMGDSGYGEEGTVGKFDVHLHLGIYVDTDQGEMSVNPYYLLKMLEKSRTVYRN